MWFCVRFFFLARHEKSDEGLLDTQKKKRDLLHSESLFDSRKILNSK